MPVNPNEAKKLYGETVTKLRDTEGELQSLTQKLDSMEAETSALKAKVEACETEERGAYDAYFLGKGTEIGLEAARKKTQAAKDAVSTHSKMIESLNRCMAGKDKGIAGLRKQVDNLRHQVWSSLFEQKSNTIPEHIRAGVKELVVIGLNCSMGRDFVLPKIFPMPNSTEIQVIYKHLSTDLGIE